MRFNADAAAIEGGREDLDQLECPLRGALTTPQSGQEQATARLTWPTSRSCC
jgi:hypothetical protein